MLLLYIAKEALCWALPRCLTGRVEETLPWRSSGLEFTRTQVRIIAAREKSLQQKRQARNRAILKKVNARLLSLQEPEAEEGGEARASMFATLSVCLVMCLGLIVAWSFWVCFWLMVFPLTSLATGVTCKLTYKKNPRPFDGRAWGYLRTPCLWSGFKEYFHFHVARLQGLHKRHNYIFAYHATGSENIGYGTMALLSSFSKIDLRVMIPEQCFYVPVMRHVLLALGFVSGSVKTFTTFFSGTRGKALLVSAPGSTGDEKMKLHSRRLEQLVKLSIRTQTKLVPVLGYGEHNMHNSVFRFNSWMRDLQEWLLFLFQLPVPGFKGKSLFSNAFGWFPRRTPISVIVGNPITPPTLPQEILKSSNSQIDTYLDTDEEGRKKFELVYNIYVKQVEGIHAFMTTESNAQRNSRCIKGIRFSES